MSPKGQLQVQSRYSHGNIFTQCTLCKNIYTGILPIIYVKSNGSSLRVTVAFCAFPPVNSLFAAATTPFSQEYLPITALVFNAFLSLPLIAGFWDGQLRRSLVNHFQTLAGSNGNGPQRIFCQKQWHTKHICCAFHRLYFCSVIVPHIQRKYFHHEAFFFYISQPSWINYSNMGYVVVSKQLLFEASWATVAWCKEHQSEVSCPSVSQLQKLF